MDLTAEETIELLKEMREEPCEEDKQFSEEIRNQRIVLFTRSFFLFAILNNCI